MDPPHPSFNNQFNPQMDPRPPFFNNQFNPQLNSHPPSKIDSQSFSQGLFNPQYPPTPFTQFTPEPSQFPSNQPSQTSDMHPPTVQKKNKGKDQGQQRERNPNWTKEEDETLCKAWLGVLEDAVTGTDQKMVKLWDRILDEFNRILGYRTDRQSSGLMNRWSSIQTHLNKYSGCVRTIQRTSTSGFSPEDSIGAAKQLYYQTQGHHFKWEGCWLILKDSNKWYNYTKEQEEKKKKIAQRKRPVSNVDVDETVHSSTPSIPATPSSIAGSVSLDDNDSPLCEAPQSPPRPSGRKAMKNMGRKKNSDHYKP